MTEVSGNFLSRHSVNFIPPNLDKYGVLPDLHLFTIHKLLHSSKLYGVTSCSVLARTVRHQTLKAEARVRSLTSECGICRGESCM